MSIEKQIKEMANIVSEVQYLGGLEEKVAERLYNAGYRKQKEGEWKLEHETYGKMICSVCGKECPTERKPDPYEDYQMTDFYVKSPFCPNCGAKMKGANDE